MNALGSFALMLLLLFNPLEIVAQGCDEKIREMGKSLGNLGYQPRAPQTRCEGLYYDNVNGVTIDLVSLTRGRIRYQLREDEIISIRKLRTPSASLSYYAVRVLDQVQNTASTCHGTKKMMPYNCP